MNLESFSYNIFSQNPLITVSFVFLIFAFTSLWINKKILVWSSFFAISILFALLSNLININAAIILIILLTLHILLRFELKTFLRVIIIIIASIVSFFLSLHLFDGFNSFKIASFISYKKYVYDFYLNFDKPFIGFFPLALNIPLINSVKAIKKIFIKTVLISFIGIFLIALIAMSFGVISYHFEINKILPVWLVFNLFFTTISEEAFFRGFLQRELCRLLKNRISPSVIVPLISIIFSVIHVQFLNNYFYLVLVFISSLLFGFLYQFTKSIESSIFCHFMLNVINMIFFTIPISF